MKIRLLEVHSGLSALIAEKSSFDGLWVSSLTHSASKGLPDNELVSLSERVALVEEVRRVSTKPIVVDIDTGGNIEHLPFYVKWFSQAGAAMLIMEDKRYPKQNSLLQEGKHQMEDVDIFCQKIKAAKAAAKNIKIIARLESLIAKRSMYEALLRADAYVEAGADGIVIHSKQEISSTEVMEFSEKFRIKHPTVLLVAIPTTYTLPEIHPFDVVIYANHLLRASLKAMQETAQTIDEKKLASVKDIFTLTGY